MKKELRHFQEVMVRENRGGKQIEYTIEKQQEVVEESIKQSSRGTIGEDYKWKK